MVVGSVGWLLHAATLKISMAISEKMKRRRISHTPVPVDKLPDYARAVRHIQETAEVFQIVSVTVNWWLA